MVKKRLLTVLLRCVSLPRKQHRCAFSFYSMSDKENENKEKYFLFLKMQYTSGKRTYLFDGQKEKELADE